MKKGGVSESTIIIGPSKSVLVYAVHSLGAQTPEIGQGLGPDLDVPMIIVDSETPPFYMTY